MIKAPDDVARPAEDIPVRPLEPDTWRERWVETGPAHESRIVRNVMRVLAAIVLVGAIWATISLL